MSLLIEKQETRHIKQSSNPQNKRQYRNYTGKTENTGFKTENKI
jgi:hypothetical protein